MKISVITVAYKNSKVVIDLLNSIAKYNDIGDELEVIIVDNSPEENRIDKAIQVADYKDYVYIKADNNGFGAGNNVGARVARGEILALLNPDIILTEPLFKKIYNMFSDDLKLAWLGCKLLLPDGSSNQSFQWRFENRRHFLDLRGRFCRKFDLFVEKDMHLWGADIFIRKKIFFEAGCFDENIFMYHEESDLTQRILRLNHGYRIRFCRDIEMIHLEGQSSPDRETSYEIIMESAIHYAQKFGIDYKKCFFYEYTFYKLKLIFDKIFRPHRVKQKEYVISCIEKRFPEFIDRKSKKILKALF